MPSKHAFGPFADALAESLRAIAETPRERRPRALRELDRLAPGLEVIGDGLRRVVFGISPDEALKVLLDPRELGQHVAELDLWKSAPVDLARMLCPVLAAGRSWLVMGRCEPFDEARAGVSAVAFARLLRPLLWRHLSPAHAGRVESDVREENMGIWCGRVVLVDYGGVEW